MLKFSQHANRYQKRAPSGTYLEVRGGTLGREAVQCAIRGRATFSHTIHAGLCKVHWYKSSVGYAQLCGQDPVATHARQGIGKASIDTQGEWTICRLTGASWWVRNWTSRHNTCKDFWKVVVTSLLKRRTASSDARYQCGAAVTLPRGSFVHGSDEAYKQCCIFSLERMRDMLAEMQTSRVEGVEMITPHCLSPYQTW